MEWIDSKERIPENGETVLCYTFGGQMISRSWMAHTDQDDKWFVKYFSHWAPLPNSPFLSTKK